MRLFNNLSDSPIDVQDVTGQPSFDPQSVGAGVRGEVYQQPQQPQQYATQPEQQPYEQQTYVRIEPRQVGAELRQPTSIMERLRALANSLVEPNPQTRISPLEILGSSIQDIGASLDRRPGGYLNRLQQRGREDQQRDFTQRMQLSHEQRAAAEAKRRQSRFEREELASKELQGIFDNPPQMDEEFTDPTTGQPSTRQTIDVRKRNSAMASAIVKLNPGAALKLLQDNPLGVEEIVSLFNLPREQARAFAKLESFDDQTKLYAQIENKRRSDLAQQREGRIEARGDADLAIKERTRTEVERHNRVIEGRPTAGERPSNRAPTRTELLLKAADGDPQALKALEIETGLRGDPLKRQIAAMLSGGQSTAPLTMGAPAQPRRAAPGLTAPIPVRPAAPAPAAQAGSSVMMLAPDGREYPIAREKIEEAKKRGLKLK